MTDLARHALSFSGALLLAGLALAVSPEAAAGHLRRLPRNVWAGRLLSALALAWGGRMLYVMPFEFLQPYKGLILPAVPVIILLTWFCMDDFLAARSLGGLAVLVPTPLLTAVRANPSDWRLAMTLTAYALIVGGIVLLLSPYRLRDAIGCALKTPSRTRAVGAAAFLYGLALGFLAFRVY